MYVCHCILYIHIWYNMRIKLYVYVKFISICCACQVETGCIHIYIYICVYIYVFLCLFIYSIIYSYSHDYIYIHTMYTYIPFHLCSLRLKPKILPSAPLQRQGTAQDCWDPHRMAVNQTTKSTSCVHERSGWSSYCMILLDSTSWCNHVEPL